MRNKSTYRGAKRNAKRKVRAEQLKKKRVEKQGSLTAKQMKALAALKDELGGNS